MYEEHKHDHRYDIGTDEEDGEPTARSDQQTWMQKEKGQDEKDKHGKQRQNAKKKPEPSLKWKALGMEEYKESVWHRPTHPLQFSSLWKNIQYFWGGFWVQ